MSLICSLSNEVPECPVVNRLSGHVYEKRLIEKYLAVNDTDPITGVKFGLDDLIEIKVPMHVKPKPPHATSIPALLKSLQDEWDAVMLYSFAQKQQMQTLKQELSHALYQYDASCRVMTRLTKEVTAAREALSTLKPQATISYLPSHAQQAESMAIDHEMDTGASLTTVTAQQSHAVQEPMGMNVDIEAQLHERSQMLTADRKKRGKQMPEELVKPDVMEHFVTKSTQIGIHSVSSPGIVALDVSKRDGNMILTGGNDKNAAVFNTATNQIVSVLKGHTKKVTCVAYHTSEELAVTASPDNTMRVWNITDASCGHVIRAHTGSVTGLSLHATGNYVLSSGSDGFWAFSDIGSGKVVLRQQSLHTKTEATQSLTCIKSHPDGLICATGTDDGEVSIWNIREAKKVAFLPHMSNGSVKSVAFSENGFYLATGGSDGLVKLWDLRKVRDFKTLSPGGDDRATYQINDLEFDNSGSYLGVAGTDVRVYLSKQWDCVVSFNEHAGLATGIRFGENANSIISSSIDRTVKLYASAN